MCQQRGEKTVFPEVNVSQLSFQGGSLLILADFANLGRSCINSCLPFALLCFQSQVEQFHYNSTLPFWGADSETTDKHEKSTQKGKKRQGGETELVRYFTQLDSRVVLNAVSTVNLALSVLLTTLFFGEVERGETVSNWHLMALCQTFLPLQWCSSPTEDINIDPSCSYCDPWTTLPLLQLSLFQHCTLLSIYSRFPNAVTITWSPKRHLHCVNVTGQLPCSNTI